MKACARFDEILNVEYFLMDFNFRREIGDFSATLAPPI